MTVNPNFCRVCNAKINFNGKIVYRHSDNLKSRLCEKCVQDVVDFYQSTSKGKDTKNQEETIDISRYAIPVYQTKEKVYEKCKEIVKGQDYVLRKLIKTIYSNLRCYDVRYMRHIIGIGKTGCGKTLSVKQLCEQLKVPYCIGSATDLTEVGYIGASCNDLICSLLDSADGDLKAAQRGVIILDEIDKIRKDNGNTRDISGEGVQQDLLTLMSGKTVMIEHRGRKHNFDTSFVTFILIGAFDEGGRNESLQEIRKNRLKKKNQKIGFQTVAEDEEEIKITEYITEDFIQYGMIQQLIARCSIILEYNDLTCDILKQIINDGKQSLLSYYRIELKNLGVNLEIEEDVITAIAEKTLRFNTGARGINRILDYIFDDICDTLEFARPEEYETCIITKHTVEDNTQYQLIKKIDKKQQLVMFSC